MVGSIYDFPDLVDTILQRSPDVVAAEVRTIDALLQQHGLRSGRILELACGTCPHGIRLVKDGFTVVGLDCSAPMLEAARTRAEAAGIPIAVIQGDIVDFAIDAEPFDAAILMFETFPLITDYDDIVSHFQSVRRHLKPGGLYIVDVDANKQGIHSSADEWGHETIPLANGSIERWFEDRPGDWVAGTNHVLLHCRIARNGMVYETIDEWHLRVYNPWTLSVLSRALDGWRLEGFSSWRSLAGDIRTEEHYFIVLEAEPLAEVNREC